VRILTAVARRQRHRPPDSDASNDAQSQQEIASAIETEDRQEMKEQRLSEVSVARQAFIRRCQRLDHGTIRGLEVHDREPFFGPKTEVLHDLKLDGDDAPRSELDLSDFELCKQIRRFFSTLDSIGNGTVEHIVVQAGIARRALFKDTDSMRGWIG